VAGDDQASPAIGLMQTFLRPAVRNDRNGGFQDSNWLPQTSPNTKKQYGKLSRSLKIPHPQTFKKETNFDRSDQFSVFTTLSPNFPI